MPAQTPLPTKYMKSIETDSPKDREHSGNSEPFHCRIIASGKSGLFITDEELRAAGASELLIDALDRNPATQKFANFSRDRLAVENFIAERNQGSEIYGLSGSSH